MPFVAALGPLNPPDTASQGPIIGPNSRFSAENYQLARAGKLGKLLALLGWRE